MVVVNRFDMSRSQLLRRLKEMEAERILFTVNVNPHTLQSGLKKELQLMLDRGAMLDTLIEKAVGSPTGAAVFYAMNKGYVVRPPFPLAGEGLEWGFVPGPLISSLQKDYRLGLILVRLGRYAVAVFEGERLVAGKAGTGLVHARHHKGGSSANRYARHRLKQMEHFFSRVEDHAREVLSAYLDEIDYILYGGERSTLTRMWKQGAFFKSLQPRTLDRLISVREPRRAAFDEAIKQAYASAVFEVIE